MEQEIGRLTWKIKMISFYVHLFYKACAYNVLIILLIKITKVK